MRQKPHFLLLCLFGLVAGAVHMQTSSALGQNRVHSGYLEPEDANNVAAVRQAGLHRDHAQAAQIVKTLQGPAHLAYVYTSIHALAQMGMETSLPQIEQYIHPSNAQESQNLDLSNFAFAAKARLLAESNTQSTTDTGKIAHAKTRVFFSQLGMSPADLNSDLASDNAPLMQSNIDGKNAYAVSSNEPKIHPVGVYAVREIADMIYHGRYEDYATLPEVKAINFNQDYPSALKVRLAQVPRENRIAVIIQELSRKTVLTLKDYYEIQLAINEGSSASEAAASELRKMDKHREQYNQVGSHSGFIAMFRIIWGVGDKKQAPLFAYFMNDSDRYVAHYARIMQSDVLKGVKREPEPAY